MRKFNENCLLVRDVVYSVNTPTEKRFCNSNKCYTFRNPRWINENLGKCIILDDCAHNLLLLQANQSPLLKQIWSKMSLWYKVLHDFRNVNSDITFVCFLDTIGLYFTLQNAPWLAVEYKRVSINKEDFPIVGYHQVDSWNVFKKEVALFSQIRKVAIESRSGQVAQIFFSPSNLKTRVVDKALLIAENPGSLEAEMRLFM